MGSYMLIEKKKTAELLPAEYNPRKDLKPGDEEYEKLKRSIEEFGFVEPVVWNEATGNVVGGHQRLKVLLDMGETEIDCVVVDLEPEKEKALNPELWDRLLTLYDTHEVEIVWVKGHAGHPENERCDRLAVEQSKKYGGKQA